MCALAALCAAASAAAATVDAAREAALAFARRGAPALLRPQAAARAVRARTAAGRTFHEVDFEGGGFAVVAGDDAPGVIAYSPDGVLGEEDDGPLWTLLRKDFALRGSAVPGRALAASSGAARLNSLVDVRVEPLLETRWGQTKAGSSYCYNYYTPAHWPCGCVATAMAQLLRHHRHPEGAVASASYNCESNGVGVTLRLLGGVYDWQNMPAVPSGSTPDEQRAAIGRLAHDCGVVMHMAYAPGGSGAVLPLAIAPLKSTFGYSNAVTYYDESGVPDAAMRNAVYANLDAGFPVLLGIEDVSGTEGADVGHAIVADGYGFSDGACYTHLNMGWNGSSDVWYALPVIEAQQYHFTIVNTLVYNVFPTGTGEIVSGRVTDDAGEPVPDASVTAWNVSGFGRWAVTNSWTTTTDAHGVYSFRLTSNTTYQLKAEKDGYRQATGSAKTTRSSGMTVTNSSSDFSYRVSASSCGNVWGNDLALERRLPATWHVSAAAAAGGDGSDAAPFASIQDAVDRASEGDVVEVSRGVYAPFATDGRRLLIRATEGPAATVVDAAYAGGCYTDERGSTNAVLSGFTFTRGYDFFCGGGVYGGTLTNCVITACRTDGASFGLGGAAYGAILDHCVLVGNSAYLSAAAEHCVLRHCTVADNVACTGSAGIGPSCAASDCVIWDNRLETGEAANYSEESVGELLDDLGYEPAGMVRCCTCPLPLSGAECIAEDPRLVDAANGDVRLRTGTPCLTSGGRCLGACETAPVDGIVVSVRTQGGGACDVKTAVVAPGASVALHFSGREVEAVATNGVPVADAGASMTLTALAADVLVEAAFAPRVFHVAANGSDAADGLGESTAMATIAGAMERAASGDEIRVHPGTYAPFSAAGKSVRVVSTDGPDATTIDAAGATRAVFLDFFWRFDAALEGFTVTGGAAEHGGGVFGGRVLRCRVVDNVATSSGGGAYAVWAASSLFADNAAVGSGRVYGGGVSQGELDNCTVAGNRVEGASGSAGSGADLAYLFNTVVFGNVCVNDDSAGEASDCADGNSFIGVDPGFVDPDNGDWRLRASGRGVDAGCEAYVDAASDRDLAGAPRVQGAAPDVGCFELECPIWISPAESTFNAYAGDGTFLVRAFGDWTLASDSSWLRLGKTSGTGTERVGFAVERNRTGAMREASVMALSEEGATADATLVQLAGTARTALSGRGRRYGLFVGIDEYLKTFVPKYSWLAGCVSDAEGLADACCSASSFWREEDCVTLVNGAATKSAVRAALADLAGRAVAGDVVLYAQASHGGTAASGSCDAFLYAYDDYYTDAELADDLALFADGVTVIVYVDACNSAGMFKDASDGLPLAASVTALLAERANAMSFASDLAPEPSSAAGADIAWITSADYHQLAFDSATGDGGMFTGAFLEGWRTGEADVDGDGALDFRELFGYAEARAVGDQGFASTPQCANEACLLGTLARRADSGMRFLLR